ncbi:hypothetical protein SNE40_013419 [Patella caerulea]|uniref:SAP domain-containing protein n=1 Tax=Patella caerulea TaxID=87958 RepID=A0AAN8JDF6_PATCE
MSNFSLWTVSKLKLELSQRHARVSGRKEELIRRLESYERNFDFIVDLPEPCPFLGWPDIGFQQLQSFLQHKIPVIGLPAINGYFKCRLATDHLSNGDLKALEKGKQMLNSKMIEACSIAIHDDVVDMTGIARASMKKI